MLNLELLDPRDPRWSSCLEADHDIYQVPSYVETDSTASQGSIPRGLFISEDANWLLCPLLVRDIDDSAWDATSPYGYPGFIYPPSASKTWIKHAWAEALAWLGKKDCASLFVRFHPDLNEGLSPELAPLAEFEREGTVFLLDTVVEPRDQLTKFRKSHRYEVRKARRGGLETAIDTNLNWFDEFIELYTQDMTRLGASKYYHFPREYFDSIASLGPERFHLRIALANGELAGASCFFTEKPRMTYHLSTINAKYRKLSPAKLIVTDAAAWAYENGYSSLNLGGGVGGSSDSLGSFKAGFGSHSLHFFAMGFVTNPTIYKELSGSDLEQHSHHFPAYRATD